MCRHAKLLFACGAGVLRTASDASTPRGSALCADPRGVLLPCLKALFCKELFVHRGECSLQLHVTPQASCYCNHSIVQLAAAACCCWHRELQWRLEEANLEIFILRGSSHSLCKELVRSPSVVRLYPQRQSRSSRLSALGKSHCCAHWRAPKIKENRGFGHQNSQFFLACRRSQCLRRLKRVFPDLTRFCSHIFGFRHPRVIHGGVHSAVDSSSL